jgi:ATP-dependent helicase/nuclease subunit B
VPRQRWERVSRDAGLAGDGDWSTRLPAYAAGQRARAAADDTGMSGRWLDDAAAADALAAFVADLRTQLGPAAEPRRWEHWAAVAHRVLRGWLGGFARIGRLPEVEQAAFQQVQASLDRVGRLDGLAEPVLRAAFADTLAAELDGAPGRAGHIGTGVHIGPIAFAVGQEFDLVLVLGACEGFMPSPPPPEALLGDADRRLTGGALALDADLAVDQQHQWWAALSGARRAVVMRPRGDLRATAHRQPSRWLAELAVDTPLGARTVPSFAAGLADAAFPVTVGQHRIRSLTHARRAGVALHEHPTINTVDPLRLGAAMIRARAESRFTEYDGDLGGLQFEPLGPHPISPTKLEAWVSCPHAWFMRYVLGIIEVEQPDEQLQITPRDRGTLVHAALDRFHHMVLDGQLPQPDARGWTPRHRDALIDAFEREGDAMHALGVTGRTAFWQAERARQHHELSQWLRRDSELVAARGARIVASESNFGMQGQDPAVIALADGTEVRMRGSVDRIDRCADGTVVVTDHKTGRSSSYKGISSDDPTLGGRKFQLVSYAAAALALTDAPAGTPVLAEYTFFAKEQYERIEARITADQWSSIAEQLERVLHHIASGLFIAIPEKSQFRRSWVACPYCDPDHLGTAEKWTEYERKAGDPRATALLATIVGGDDD